MDSKVNTPDNNTHSIIYATPWAIALLFVALVTLPLFLFALLLIGLLRNGDNFGTVEEGPSHTITQNPAPPFPLLCLLPIWMR